MIEEITRWWLHLWSDPKIFGAAIGRLLTGLTLFLLSEIWRNRSARAKLQEDRSQQRLNELYAPLYSFYRESYTRFERWRAKNPGTLAEQQPFFRNEEDESMVTTLLNERAGLASQQLIVSWTALRAGGSSIEKQHCRSRLVQIIVKDYQKLRRDLGLDYDQHELLSGNFIRWS